MAQRLHVLSSHLKSAHSTSSASYSNTSAKAVMANPITTHVLDTALGQPARGVPVAFSYLQGGDWVELGSGRTDDNGRCGNLVSAERFKPGTYRIRFHTSTYFQSLGNTQPFYPYVEVVFNLNDTAQHYHIPLLLSPYSYSTYRGS